MNASNDGWAPLKTWPRRLAKHIVAGGKGWFWFAAVCFVLATPILVGFFVAPESQETTLRWLGMLLQLVGFFMAILGIEGSLKFAGAPTVARGFLTYLKGFVVSLRTTTHHLTANSVVATTSFGSGLVTQKPSPNATIDQRLKLLEDSFERLQKSVWEQKSKLDEVEKSISLEAKKLSDELTSQIKDLKSYVDKFQVGSALYEFVGIVFFAFGVVYSTIPEFIQWLANLVLS